MFVKNLKREILWLTILYAVLVGQLYVNLRSALVVWPRQYGLQDARGAFTLLNFLPSRRVLIFVFPFHLFWTRDDGLHNQLVNSEIIFIDIHPNFCKFSESKMTITPALEKMIEKVVARYLNPWFKRKIIERYSHYWPELKWLHLNIVAFSQIHRFCFLLYH